MLKKSHPLSRYTRNGGKNNLKNFLMHFHFAIELNIQLCDNCSSALFICLTPFSQGSFGLIGMILMKEFVSLTTVSMFLWKMLQWRSYHWKIDLIGYLILGEIQLCNLKNIHFEKKSPKTKKENITILYFLTTLNNVALKTKTGFELQGCLRPL